MRKCYRVTGIEIDRVVEADRDGYRKRESSRVGVRKKESNGRDRERES